jgi:hypothetical protein
MIDIDIIDRHEELNHRVVKQLAVILKLLHGWRPF